MYRQFNMNKDNGGDSDISELIVSYSSIQFDDESILKFLEEVRTKYDTKTPDMLLQIVEQTLNNEILTTEFLNYMMTYLFENREKFENVLGCFTSILNKISVNLAFRLENLKCRKLIAKLYEETNDYYNAYQILSSALADEFQRYLKNDQKLALNLDIAEYNLKLYSVKDAEIYINRANQFFSEHNGGITKDNIIVFKLYASMLDMKGRFLEASQRYSDLSTDENINDDIDYFLRCTVSAILVPASQSRHKFLTNFSKDDRCKSKCTFNIIQKMSKSQMITEVDINAIWAHLLPYQQKEDLLKKVRLENNIVSISEVYTTIHLESAAELLGVTAEESEFIIAEMISEDRLSGTIDQLSGYARFPKNKLMPSWDCKIEWICNSINSIVQKIETKYPDWTPQA